MGQIHIPGRGDCHWSNIVVICQKLTVGQNHEINSNWDDKNMFSPDGATCSQTQQTAPQSHRTGCLFVS